MDRMAQRTLQSSGEITEPLGGLSVKVRGIVQGVGFRPFIFNLADRLSLTGWVKNTSSGVEIELDGTKLKLQDFLRALSEELPPLARIDNIVSETRSPNGYAQFEILPSLSLLGEFQPVPPDIGICPDCTRELFDPTDRRFHYPFINCTNCGPRFTIIRDLPYDRPFTTMAEFPLCSDCAREYHDPHNRRFHAQPIACPACGPRTWLQQGEVRISDGYAAIHLARRLLADGKILAVKGLGGFHLACDATNPTAVAELHRRKNRSDKPFALMAYDLTFAQKHCQINAAEADLLLSRQAPIVLLERQKATSIVENVAPGQSTIGLMLAYTPLHLLLLEPSPDFPEILVMTSGNVSEEPIAYRDEDALTRLTPLSDAILFHDRPIHMRVDDSVVTCVHNDRYYFRRSRGEAPNPVLLPFNLPPLLAAGAELKNTFCFTRDQYAFISHHIGDLENYETFQSYEEGIAHFEKLFRIQPSAITCDLHPNYLSTRYAEERARRQNLPLIKVQHHHAHLASCLADNHWETTDPVIGLCFDGTGFGLDGAIWGGEVLLGGYTGFERLSHLAYTPLPGGDIAVRKPARMALSLLRQAGYEWEQDLPAVEALCSEERSVISAQIRHHINSPLTSSMGRLFDAVSSLIGLRHTATYEGQAAIELEAAADPMETGFYLFDIHADEFNPQPVLFSLLADWRNGLGVSKLAARFHNTVAHLALDLCQRFRAERNVSTVALSGGVWQNRFLLHRTLDILHPQGYRVLIHRQIPTNDGGIALGQAVIGAHQR
jgi:hydrogenase maturation protein HypF